MHSFTLLLLALTPFGVLSQRVSTDATCGGSKGYTCLGSSFGNCCSSYGWCGSKPDYCGSGCNPKFGSCNNVLKPSTSSSGKTPSKSTKSSNVPAPSSTQRVTTNARCGRSYGGSTCQGSSWGDCCSQYGYCGSGPEYCAADKCQKGYGKCNTVSSSRSPVQKSTMASASVSRSPSTSVSRSPSTSVPSSAAASSSSSKSVLISSSTATLPLPVSQAISSSVSTSQSSLLTASTSISISSIDSSKVATSSNVPTDSATSQSLTPTAVSSPTNNDSPPYSPTASVVLPSDPAGFMATYTFQDEGLPTPIEMGSPPVTTGVTPVEANLVKTCLIVPTQPDVTFQLLDVKDRIPLMKRSDGALGAPKAPQSEAEMKAMGPIEDLKFASFSFVAGGNDLFDLVINDSPRQYVARKSDGSVILTDRSTGADDAQLATSIFDITCEGRITIRIGSQHYTWALRENDSVMQASDGTPETMYALPDSPAAEKRRRRGKSQEGAAPRCNAYPRPLEARVFPGARGNNPNQCGSAAFNVPDLSFGSCCDQHDNDFDDCGMTFEEGNSRFHSCMRGRGCDHLNHWYTWPAYLGCLKTADFYNSVVSGYFGKKAFYEANTDRCKCYCAGSTPHGCMVGGSFQCLNVLGTDTNNCGACGRKCPEGSRCENGQCKCPADQCGDRCVTLASHPKHCGKCNRVSTSGYCVQGQFYTPPAFCSRGNGFKNGNFANRGNDWNAQIVSGGGNSRFDVGSDGGAEDADRMVGIFSLYPPNGGANLKTAVKMCPGPAYSLSFQIRRPYGTNTCYYYVYVAGELKNNGQVPKPASTGAGWQWISGLRVGPFFGERQGVSVAGPELWADFQLDIRCESNGAPYDFIRVDQFSIVPT